MLLLAYFGGLDEYRGAVSQDFGDALHHFGSVIARANDGVGA